MLRCRMNTQDRGANCQTVKPAPMPCLDAGFYAVASGDQPPDQVMLVRVDD